MFLHFWIALTSFACGLWLVFSHCGFHLTHHFLSYPGSRSIPSSMEPMSLPLLLSPVSYTSQEVHEIDAPVPWLGLNPEGGLQRAWLLAEGPARSTNTCKKWITFTFDDGPSPEITPAVLWLLAQHQVRATFFWIGRYLSGTTKRSRMVQEVARQVLAAGHLIGNHTYDHRYLPRLDRTQALAQIQDGAAAIEKTIGMRPIFFRPPYGALDEWTEQLVGSQGLEVVMWSIDVDDMRQNDVDAMLRKFKNQLEFARGGLILLHDVRPSTVQVLTGLLDWLKTRRFVEGPVPSCGYEIVDLVEYLRLTALHPQPYRNRCELQQARIEKNTQLRASMKRGSAKKVRRQ
ncbi:polysaccharide deacetylase family protein [Pajaroellobacter abortibovis]|uniref:NodB homology domain-containing protein n=1 Tax=Pajaroellobacter abortibovis TaxID=1882918 RepID=A0A1L6MV19_9BACT|nr:polysaccharide deacetylase family protein [Pajaroellobacter abortibovis]APR99321.1 hypothetical protein BCY86_00495 [Pajaroellobacter abortibovis]